MTNEQPEQWAVDVEYLAKLADWAAGQGFCQLDGLPDPDEWCYDKWNELFPKSCGDDYSAQALADGLIASIQRAFAEREAELMAENFRLAAGACINPGQHGLVGDAHGNGVCTAFEALNASERENAELVAENAKLREELEICGHAQANLVRVAEKARNRWKEAQDNLDLILPFVAKFAAAVGHYDRTPPRFPGSSFNHDPDPGSHLALSVSVHGQAPMQGPTITDLRLLAEAYNIVTSQALAQQDTAALKSREADRG